IVVSSVPTPEAGKVETCPRILPISAVWMPELTLSASTPGILRTSIVKLTVQLAKSARIIVPDGVNSTLPVVPSTTAEVKVSAAQALLPVAVELTLKTFKSGVPQGELKSPHDGVK